MFRILRFRRDKEAAYQAQQYAQIERLQRWLVLAGGAGYGLAGLWISVAVGDSTGGLLISSFALLAVTLLLWGLTYTTFVRDRLEIVPIIIALIFGWHQVFSLAFVPEGGALRAAFLFGSLAAFVTLMSPTVQSSLAAIITATLMAALGFGVVFPLQGVHIDLVETLAFGTPLFMIIIALALALDHARREAFSYKHELARRATTDDISGVSNRAHIHQLAQNEFGRARRYKEPLSVVMIEIDSFDDILERSGPIALDTLIQVFSGYCVVVMRHCDSFGRLGPKRFLALLPETGSKGAMVLANRMCRDLAALDVMAEDETINFTVTIGAAELYPTDKWAGDLMRRASQALDDAIESGRNTAVLAGAPPQLYANDQAPMVTGEANNLQVTGGGTDMTPPGQSDETLRKSA